MANNYDIKWALSQFRQFYSVHDDANFEAFMDGQFEKLFWFLRLDRKTTEVYCEACGNHFEIYHPRDEVPRHQEPYRCLACGETNAAWNLRLSRKSMCRDGLITWWHKAESDPGTVFAATYYVMRDYREGPNSDLGNDDLMPWQVETDVKLHAVCAFNYDRRLAQRWEHEHLWAREGPDREPMIPRNKCESPVGAVYGKGAIGGCGHNYFNAYSSENMRTALEGTRIGTIFDLCEPINGEYSSYDLIPEIANIVLYPQVEYLIKMGCRDIAARRIDGQSLHPYLNWRGKTAEKVLKIPAQDIKAARSAGIEIDYDYVRAHREIQKRGMKWQPPAIERFATRLARAAYNALRDIDTIFEATKLRKVYKFIVRQDNMNAISDCLDYWRDCIRLRRDMRDDQIIFPRDLPARHAADRARIKHLASKEAEEKIAKLLPKHEARFQFIHGGIVLRPARSGEEIIAEGEALHHCVGGYVDRYASGGTVICVMRKLGELDKPWRTVELTPEGRVVQDCGDHNDAGKWAITEELKSTIDEFWAAYAAWQKQIGGKAA